MTRTTTITTTTPRHELRHPAPRGRERTSTMTTQQYVARGITEGRAWSRQDRAQLRDIELARPRARRALRPWRREVRDA